MVMTSMGLQKRFVVGNAVGYDQNQDNVCDVLALITPATGTRVARALGVRKRRVTETGYKQIAYLSLSR